MRDPETGSQDIYDTRICMQFPKGYYS